MHYYVLIVLLLYVISDFGQGVGPIHRTQVLCQGFEPNLFTCPSQQDTSSCDHSMDAGVICISELLNLQYRHSLVIDRCEYFL